MQPAASRLPRSLFYSARTNKSRNSDILFRRQTKNRHTTTSIGFSDHCANFVPPSSHFQIFSLLALLSCDIFPPSFLALSRFLHQSIISEPQATARHRHTSLRAVLPFYDCLTSGVADWSTAARRSTTQSSLPGASTSKKEKTKKKTKTGQGGLAVQRGVDSRRGAERTRKHCISGCIHPLLCRISFFHHTPITLL